MVGTNFTKADTHLRSTFAVTPSSMDEAFDRAAKKGLAEFIVLSTCNRTEFYACAPVHVLINLVREQLNLLPEEIDRYFYVRTGAEAARHFLRVTVGLDSQIVGDYEIAGQVKKAVQYSRQKGMIGTFTDRISSSAFQASKEIKAKTTLSSGKYSVSFAALELISTYRASHDLNKILIVGTGEAGQAIARNLAEHFEDIQLTFANRTLAHAEDLARDMNVPVLPFEELTQYLNQFDAVVTAIQSDHYIIEPEHVPGPPPKLFLDLSVPQVINPEIRFTEGIELYTVDEISATQKEVMNQRTAEIPRAEAILDEFMLRLLEWQTLFMCTDVIQTYKDRLHEYLSPDDAQVRTIDKSFSRLIKKIKVEGYRGCSVILTVNELIGQQ